jgi:hypothetical protein
MCITLIGTGCISLIETETGSAPGPEAVERLRKGASLDVVLEICGAPVQTVAQPDGLLLVYRERHYDFKRVGFEPGIVASLVDFTGIIRTTLENMKLVFEWGVVVERRLVVLFDKQDRVSAIAYRDVGVER